MKNFVDGMQQTEIKDYCCIHNFKVFNISV